MTEARSLIEAYQVALLAGAVVTNAILAKRAWKEAVGIGRKWSVALLAVLGTSTLGWIVARAFAV